MHYQWMVEKPNDFELKWLMLPCPKGRRIIVATREVRLMRISTPRVTEQGAIADCDRNGNLAFPP